LQTQAGEVKLRVPKLRKLPFETAIIERYRRRECSVEEALWGTRVSAGTVSHLNQKSYENIEKWRNLTITGSFAYVYADGIWLKRSWSDETCRHAWIITGLYSRTNVRHIGNG
jgi:putative transposase